MRDSMDPIEELKKLFGIVLRSEESGKTYFLIPQLAMPDGCTPARTDVLLCPSERDGYPSRLFFAERVACKGTPNWTTVVRILERTWHAFSWRVPQTDLRPAQLVLAHLKGLR